MDLCEVVDDSPVAVRLQARYVQKAWESLVETYKSGNPKAQRLVLLMRALTITGLTATASFHLLKLCKVVDEANLRYLPEYGRPGRLLSQPTLRERRNGRRVVDCGGKGRVATDITSYSRQLYRLENQHDVVIMCDVITRPSELSEQVHEDAAVLTQAIYLENHFYLTLGRSAPVMTGRIERKFRLDPQVRIMGSLFVVGHEVDLAIWFSERTRSCSIYVH